MINLFDTYHQKSWDLHFSLLKAGYQHPTIVLEDDGWLPEDLVSPYQYIISDHLVQGKPLFFNQLPIPDLWEIKGNGQEASVWDYQSKRAMIHYAKPKHKRLIQRVDWLDKAGKLLTSDHYNRKGYRFAQSLYDSQTGELLSKTYYNVKQEEILVENYKTKDVILNHSQQVTIFPSQVAFYAYYLSVSGFDMGEICYNSLGKSFLTAVALKQANRHTLFWQEGITDKLPGNMQYLLNKEPENNRIVVQDRRVFDKLKSLVPDSEFKRFSYLGFLYPFKPNPEVNAEALIVTNSDQIEQVEDLIKELPDVTFNIAAVTEMSSKLVRLKMYPNVRLYPNSSPELIEELFKKSSFYLDINYGRELLSSVRTAFERELLLLAFDKTVHNRRYISEKQLFNTSEREKMAALIQACLDDSHQLYSLLDSQREYADVSTIASYQELIG